MENDRISGVLRAGRLAGLAVMTVIGGGMAFLPPAGAVPVPIPAQVRERIDAGTRHTCVVDDAFAVRCWGQNHDGQLGHGLNAEPSLRKIGDNEAPSTAAPVDLGGNLAWKVATGALHSCAVLVDGGVVCWGQNRWGVLGSGNQDGGNVSIGDDEVPADVPVDGDILVNLGRNRTAKAIAAGGSHTCVIDDLDDVMCWGLSSKGQLGYPDADEIIGDDEDPGQVNAVELGPRHVRAIAAGEDHTCAVTDSGAVYCWGDNTYGATGLGTPVLDLPPAGQVDLGGTGVTTAVAGYDHTCTALAGSVHHVRCWGRVGWQSKDGRLGLPDLGTFEDLGDDELPSSASWVRLAGDSVVALAAGTVHTCAVTTAGAVRCWGDNAEGALGNALGVSSVIGDDETPGAIRPEDLLRRAVGDRAAEVWAWLENRPYIGRGSDGLYAHDLVRDLIAADLRRRSPEAYRRVHRLVHDHAVNGLRRAGGADRWVAAHQKVFLLRRTPLAGPVWSLPELRTAAVTPGRHDDRPAVLALIERFEGVESAAVAARWLAAQPENLVVVRTSAGLAGCAFQCVWPADPALHDADPVLRAALATADRISPARPGEQISVARYVIGPDGHERDPHAALAASVMSTVDWATRPLAWSFTATTDPDHWGPIFNYLALTTQATVASAGLSHTVYGIDWRRLPVERWLDLVGERELTGETGPPPPELLRPPPLDRDRFDRAVRQALLHLNRPDQLTGNPLLGTSLAADLTPACLRATLLTAIDHLAQDPRSLPLRRVLDRTYLHPAPTQEAAAEALHLSFSTYRRHLAKATIRLTDLLWSQELAGTPLDLQVPPR
ncbi:RCC1 domain-containing protein [Actinomadura coerulea]|uniref:RCC1 domain-containing protein n=1 Tax=Actinomadura coerulea TaxID=46159 RepID=UPI00341689E9